MKNADPDKPRADPAVCVDESFLQGCREEFDSGNRWALMQAIDACAAAAIPLPIWAADAYRLAFESVRTAKAKSWDDAFGKPWKKGKQLIPEQRRQLLMWKVHDLVRSIVKEEGAPIDGELFERVCKEIKSDPRFNSVKLRKSLAMEYYYAAKKLNDALLFSIPRYP